MQGKYGFPGCFQLLSIFFNPLFRSPKAFADFAQGLPNLLVGPGRWVDGKKASKDTHTHTHTYTGWEVGDPCSASLDYMYFHSWLLTSKARLCKFQSPPTVLSLNSTSSDRLGYRPSPLLSWLRLLWPWSNIAASSKAIESRSPTKH